MPFDQPRELTDDDIRRLAPSVFATAPAPTVSDRYSYLPSYPVLRSMRLMGLVPTQVREGRKKNPDGREYAMHEIRFRKVDDDTANKTRELGMLVPEALLRNSHDRTSPLDLQAGISRLVCLNGMTVMDSGFHVKLRHAGTNPGMVQDAVQTIVSSFGRAIDKAKEWAAIPMAIQQQLDFAMVALDIRGTALAIEPQRVLAARRFDDRGNDLWNVFNRVQENMTKGGILGMSATGRNRMRTLGAVQTLKADIDLNRKLWAAAQSFAASVA